MFAVSTARPDGAPGAVCGSLIPAGPHDDNGIVEQPTPNPWTIDICDFEEVMGFYVYRPGATYNSKLIVVWRNVLFWLVCMLAYAAGLLCYNNTFRGIDSDAR